jgi:hypothetical protein
MDELEKLRDAHTTLISMIKNHHIDVEDDCYENDKLILQTDKVPHRFSDILLCGRGESNRMDSSRGSVDQEQLTK